MLNCFIYYFPIRLSSSYSIPPIFHSHSSLDRRPYIRLEFGRIDCLQIHSACFSPSVFSSAFPFLFSVALSIVPTVVLGFCALGFIVLGFLCSLFVIVDLHRFHNHHLLCHLHCFLICTSWCSCLVVIEPYVRVFGCDRMSRVHSSK